MNILIAGGGIGGATAALCLHHFGHQVRVLEQAAQPDEVGAGIQISPNGMKVFQALQVDRRIAKTAFCPQALEMRIGTSGRKIFSIPAGAQALARWGAPYLHIHRADLLSALHAELAARAPNVLRLGTQVTGYTQTETHVDVQCADGAPMRCDVLIAADGIHSAIRAQMLGPDTPRFTGNVAWRATVPMSALGALAPPPTACVWVGPGRHAVTYRLRGGALANFVGVVERDDWRHESWTLEGSRQDALADFAGWHPIVRQVIASAGTYFRWALYDRAPLATWTEGRVALLGDACHPTLPFMAQGACMAIEDAWVLAASLTKAPTRPARALNAYFASRIARTSALQRAARANAKTFHKRSVVQRVATYGPMWLAGKLAPGFVNARQDWIYGHDVTASP